MTIRNKLREYINGLNGRMVTALEAAEETGFNRSTVAVFLSEMDRKGDIKCDRSLRPFLYGRLDEDDSDVLSLLNREVAELNAQIHDLTVKRNRALRALEVLSE